MACSRCSGSEWPARDHRADSLLVRRWRANQSDCRTPQSPQNAVLEGIERLVQTLEPDGPDPWYSRYASANLYPVGTDNTDTEWGASSSGALKEAQDEQVANLFSAWMEMLDARWVIMLAGPHFWWVLSRRGFASLGAQPRPLIASGRFDGRSWVMGYHPGYAFRQGQTTESYVGLLVSALRRLDGG